VARLFVLALVLGATTASADVTRSRPSGLRFQGTVERVASLDDSPPRPAIAVDSDPRWYVEIRENGSSSGGARLRALCQSAQLIRLELHSPTRTFRAGAEELPGKAFTFHLTEVKEGGRTTGWRLAVGPPSFTAADARALAMSERLEQLLTSRIWVGTPPAFRIIALSHVADGCARQAATQRGAAQRCVTRALELAAKEQPAKYDPKHPDDSGLHASHLNLILGAQDVVGGAHDADLHARLSGALAQRSQREPTHHVPSFFNGPMRWPADQSATLASLQRFDAAHGQHLAPPAITAWRAFLDTHSADGLPWSEVTGNARHARLPRGCALSFGIRYTAEFDPELAGRWWKVYKQRYLVDRLLVGFREWPPGQDLAPDVDSGPIVMGVGAAATAFGLAAARAVKDDATGSRLEITANTLGTAAALDPSLAAARDSTLAQAILFEAR
jgi:hypothetical protein